MSAATQSVHSSAPTTLPMATSVRAGDILMRTTRTAAPSTEDIAFLNRWMAQRDGEDGVHAVVRNLVWLLDLPVSSEEIDAQLPKVEGYPALGAVKRYLAGYGIRLGGLRPDPAHLEGINVPAVAPLQDGQVVLIVRVGRGRVFFLDPIQGWGSMPRAQFGAQWIGILLASTEPAFEASGAPLSGPVEPIRGSEIDLRVRNNGLSPNECGALLSLVTGFRSSRVAGDAGASVVKMVRTSRSASLPLDDELTQKVMQLGAEAFGVSVSHCEGPTVIAYKPGQQFRHHQDAFSDAVLAERGHRGNRLGTVLVYLNDDILGGETHFPLLDRKIAPRIGRVVSWRNLDANGAIDPKALHAGLPIYSGMKFVVAMHVWSEPLDRLDEGR